jgi:hypothetical protein
MARNTHLYWFIIFLVVPYIEIIYPADNPLIVSDYEVGECVKIAEEIYKIVKNLI